MSPVLFALALLGCSEKGEMDDPQGGKGGGLPGAGEGGDDEPIDPAERGAAKQTQAFITVLNGLAGKCEAGSGVPGVTDLDVTVLIDGEEDFGPSARIGSAGLVETSVGSHHISVKYAVYECPDEPLFTQTMMLEAGHDYVMLLSGTFGAEQVEMRDLTDDFDGVAGEVLLANLTSERTELKIVPSGADADAISWSALGPLEVYVVQLPVAALYGVLGRGARATPVEQSFRVFEAGPDTAHWYDVTSVATVLSDEQMAVTLETGNASNAF